MAGDLFFAPTLALERLVSFVPLSLDGLRVISILITATAESCPSVEPAAVPGVLLFVRPRCVFDNDTLNPPPTPLF